ncbi:probable receptor-like protein kinase At1g49730 [Zingiber officinale]|uniref:probable receptor-like protein kinase At1g49730 n=1 Tax=Zingiber officinale TaxID=94328 RepID=UPI001C4B51E1|nr:probable receptor-like protein kinase At1g49730 [Zingiber officinale]
MRSSLLRFSFAAALVLAAPPSFCSASTGCPLDMSWWNLTAANSVCSNQNERAKCCRYINAFIAVSVAHYANSTGMLGVPPELSDVCYSSINETLISSGMPSNAIMLCGLGLKIRVSYQCAGRGTISDMLQSPNFDEFNKNCKLALSLDNSCRMCLTSGLSYLRHLVGEQDNVTLNTCHDAAFVAIANQGDNSSVIDLASCFFSVKVLSIYPVNSSESSFLYLAPASSPASSPIPVHDLFVTPFKEHHRAYQLTLIPGIGIIIIGVAILLLVIVIILIQRKNRQLKGDNSPDQSTLYASSSQHVWKNKKGTSPICCRYSYKEIKKATGNFSTIIGQDGFGMLYKAQFDNGFPAAVKLNNNLSELSEQEFSQEMEFLGRLHHRHILTLKGICYSRQERFMVYEFMENGSLKHQLHSSSGRTQLAWKTRVQIAVDVANALEYLHFYCDTPICHGDLRPSNVLLDKNFLAKVAYFGLEHSTTNAKRFLDHNENALGASGYLDPEYMVSQKMTNKSDVYSFGVLLLELVSGKQAFDNNNLVQWFQDLADTGLTELADPAIADSVNLEQLHVVLQIANMCTQKESRERPSIKQVLRMLYEQLDPLYIGFAKAVQDEGCYGGGRVFIEKQPVNEIIAFSGDARCLQSSSSTSRSYCSRSILLECNSPQSPHGI